MLRIMRGFRIIQRRFATIVLASVLIFLIYLLLTNSSHLQSAKSVQEKDQPFKAHPREQPLSGPGGVVHMDQGDRSLPHLGKTEPKNGGILDVLKRTTKSPADVPLSDRNVNVPRTVLGTKKPTKRPDNQIKDGTEEINLGKEKKPGKPANPDLPPLATDLNDPYSGPRNAEQQEIVSAFLHAWRYYKKYAWGHDELKPVSKGWQEWMGIGLTIVDSLDTIYIMGLKEEFKLGRDWVAESLTFDRDHDVQLFEITIRALGGLLSAYHLSGDKVFLDKALDLGKRLYPCFGGHTSVPCNRMNLKKGRAHFMEISTAESGTIQLEFRDLARATSTRKYEKAVEAVSDHLHKLKKLDGLVACFLNPHTGEFRTSSTVSVGASADSYYEYLIKQWIQTGKSRDWLRTDYLEAVKGIQTHLYRHTFHEKLGFVGSYINMNSRGFRPDMEHLACFLPGTLALGYMAGLKFDDHLKMAENLTRTCYEMYARMPTGLSPEVATMSQNANAKNDIYVSTSYAYNLQRPETVESIFYMYRATKDPKYRKWGWEIFKAFEKYTRLEEGGYASISNVKNPEVPGYRDKMETFYLAETLKYLYLLFSDDPNLIPLDKFVINTEAHPLPVYSS